LPDDFEAVDEKIEVGFQSKFIKKIVKIGEVRSLEINVYQITHHSENDPRISLSRDSFRLLAQYGIKRALILFISENSLNYRLSLVTIDLKWEEGKRVKKEYSNPHRYSFFLGPETKTHTPETYLIEKGRVKDFEDLKKRFSIEVVNKDFYAQIAILFTKIAGGKRTIGRKKYEEKGSLILPSTIDDKTKKEFSVRLIGRLIFCWFLKKKTSDKGVPLISEELLSSKSVAQKTSFYHNILEPLFFETLNTPIKQRKKEYQIPPWSQIPFLNGGLFMPEDHDYYHIDQLRTFKYINILKVPDSWLKELFEVFETYNFTIDENTPVDVELSIEPEMLGRIFENLLAEINPETGNTARKSTGSYYTPRPIVEYMVDESLKQYLFSKTNLDKNKISSLLAYEEEEVGLSESEKDVVLDALDVIKIIDPACGSGAFPMGILQKMLIILQKIDPESKKWLLKKLLQIDDGNIRKKDTAEKLQKANRNYVHKIGIIQNSIYGVDIQTIAIDISKLRFFLSLIVDERIDDSKPNRGIESLPNLEFKFVCANSLIGLPKLKERQPTFDEITDVNAQNEIKELKKIRDEYLLSYGDKKIKLKEKFKLIQNRLFISSIKSKDTSQSKALSQWDPFIGKPSGWFDPEWMFGINDGFDIVIANPPYVNVEKIDKSIKKNIKIFKTAYQKYDLYVLFYEKGIDLLKEKGILTFISSNKFLSQGYGLLLRKLFLKYQINQIINFNYDIFESAVVRTCIFQLIKKNANKNKIKVIEINCHDDAYKFSDRMYDHLSQEVFKSTDENNFRINLTNEKIKILGKIKQKFLQVYDICSVNYGLRPVSLIKGQDKYFFIKKENPRDKYKKYFEGKNMGNWMVKESSFIDYQSKIMYNPMFPELFENEKLAGLCTLSDIEKLRFVYDNTGIYCNHSVVILTLWHKLEEINYSTIKRTITKDKIKTSKNFSYKYLQAILNSRIIKFYVKELLYDGTHFYPNHIKQLPIKNISSKNQKPFIEIVDKILSITKSSDYLENSDKQAKVHEYERQINQMVYKLYGLTDDEIETVENFDNKK